MNNKILTLLNDQNFIRNLIQGNNIIWYLMYYDEIIIKNNYQLTLLKNADLPFYNTAQAVSAINPENLKMIEEYYTQHNINPAFYLDPASVDWLQPYLLKNNYMEIPSELENWWGILLEEEILDVVFQDYLKISETQIKTKIINPKNLHDLNQFLEINQIASDLPDHIVSKLRIHMQDRAYSNASNSLLIIYVNNIPASTRAIGLYNNIAYLAEAGTLPEFRKLGLHTYTTLYCLKYAFEQGIKIAALTCTHDSVTNFTAKRTGLELLFQRQYLCKKNNQN